MGSVSRNLTYNLYDCVIIRSGSELLNSTITGFTFEKKCSKKVEQKKKNNT